MQVGTRPPRDGTWVPDWVPPLPLHHILSIGLTTELSESLMTRVHEMGPALGLGLVAGQWLDGQIHTGMLFTLIGVFTGLVAGITSIVALYRATLRSSELECRGESVRKGKTTRQ